MTESDDELFPLELNDSPYRLLDNVASFNNDTSETIQPRKERRMSVREIKISRAECGYSVSKELKRLRIKQLWLDAFHKVLNLGDPWEKINFNEMPVEKAKRYRYNALKDKWVEDVIEIKIQPKEFSRGAMRKCFRVKRAPRHQDSKDWSHGDNYVAKSYIDPVDDQIYFDDVKLQMDAKLWGEDFNRQPAIARKIDIIQMSIIKMIDRPSQPLYHLEHFIEGSYKKYNSNSGFVDEHMRNTPHAFSHFTFERSGHKLIVVDIQGVGDLWTDPQIHTVRAGVYGDGNLGIRGMALFFHSHQCNALCKALGLAPFDLLKSEYQEIIQQHRKHDVIEEEDECGDVFGGTMAAPVKNRRQFHRNISDKAYSSSSENDLHPPSLREESDMEQMMAQLHEQQQQEDVEEEAHFTTAVEDCPEDVLLMAQILQANDGQLPGLASPSSSSAAAPITTDNVAIQPHRRRRNQQSECWPDTPNSLGDAFMNKCSVDSGHSFGETNQEKALNEFSKKNACNRKSSSVEHFAGSDARILGEIHHELARLHESGRFARERKTAERKSLPPSNNGDTADYQPGGEINWKAVLFHEEKAALMNCLEAVMGLANYCLGREINGPLSDCPIKPNLDRELGRGLCLMNQAAGFRDRTALMYLAEANYDGQNNNPIRELCLPDWGKAADFYQRVIDAMKEPLETPTDSDSDEDPGISMGFDALLDWPLYKLYGRLAEMYAQGEHNLAKDHLKAYELFEYAADGAMEVNDGRLAMKYYEMMETLDVE